MWTLNLSNLCMLSEKGLSQTICRAAKERGVSPYTLIII